MRAHAASASASMGELLLQGWCMTADGCDVCGVPLMRHPEGQPLLCVSCGATSTGAAGEHTGPGGDAKPVLPHANGIGHSPASSVAEPAGLVQPPPSLSARLRAGLAIAESGADDVQLNISGSGGSGAGASGLTSLSQLGAAPAASARAARAPPPTRQSGVDASRGIAELMLEGWAMLAEHCPRCLNPLLRSPDRRTYCAGCQLYVVHEGEQGQQQAGGTPAQATPAAAGEGGNAPAQAATPAPPLATRKPPPRLLDGTPVLQRHLPAVDAAAAVVAARLSSAAADLAAAEPAAAPRLLAEVQQCGAALQALADCRRSMAGGA